MRDAREPGDLRRPPGRGARGAARQAAERGERAATGDRDGERDDPSSVDAARRCAGTRSGPPESAPLPRSRGARRRCLKRFSGSFSRQRRRSSRTSGRPSGGSALQSGPASGPRPSTSDDRLAARTPGGRRASRTGSRPSDQMSVRRSSGLPRACSGRHVAAFPDHARLACRRRHGRRIASTSSSGSRRPKAFARPKSRTLTCRPA